MPSIAYTGKTIIVTNAEDAEIASEELMQEDIFGFDTETKPVFVSGKSNSIAIIQIASSEKVYIFHVKRFPIKGKFKEFLESPKYLKVGVAIRDDVKKIYKYHKVQTEASFDLTVLSKERGILEAGLRTLTARVFGRKISKRQQLSNWDNFPLSESQIIYAATDAWLCRELYFELQNCKP
jgi:ribonuclease D